MPKRSWSGLLLLLALIALGAVWLGQNAGRTRFRTAVSRFDGAASHYVLTDAARLDLNRADASELSQLPGVGESLAQRIVDDRLENGPFERVEAVSRVSGVGERILEGILPLVCVTSAEAPPQ